MFDPIASLDEIEKLLKKKHPEIVSITCEVHGCTDNYYVTAQNHLSDSDLAQLQADLYDDFLYIYEPNRIGVDAPHLIHLEREV